MSKLQKLLYPLVIVGLIVLAAVFWGSIASILFAFCAISSLSVYLWQRFLNRDSNSDFYEDNNG